MLDKLIKALEIVEEHTKDCGYITMTLEVRDILVNEIKQTYNKGFEDGRKVERDYIYNEGL
ncbi:hypothetical protein [Clostridium sp.]